MPNVLLGLGPTEPATSQDQYILFYVPLPNHDTPNFQSWTRDTQYTWVAQDRLSRDPAMQFVGPGEDSIVIEGKMFPYHFGGLSTIDRLRAAGRGGKPHVLVRFFPLDDPPGSGAIVIGNYVIKRIRTAESNIGVSGIAHKIEFTIELVKYGDDAPYENNQPEFAVT